MIRPFAVYYLLFHNPMPNNAKQTDNLSKPSVKFSCDTIDRNGS